MQKDPACKVHLDFRASVRLLWKEILTNWIFKCSQTLPCSVCCEMRVRPLTPDRTEVFTFQHGLCKQLDSMASEQTLGFAIPLCDKAQITGISMSTGMWASVLYTPLHLWHTGTTQHKAHLQTHATRITCAENGHRITYFIIRKISSKKDCIKYRCS